MKRVLLLALALAFSGCGESGEAPTPHAVQWLRGRATVVPLHSALITLNHTDAVSYRILLMITGGHEMGTRSIYVAPKQFAADCKVGILPPAVCP